MWNGNATVNRRPHTRIQKSEWVCGSCSRKIKQLEHIFLSKQRRSEIFQWVTSILTDPGRTNNSSSYASTSLRGKIDSIESSVYWRQFNIFSPTSFHLVLENWTLPLDQNVPESFPSTNNCLSICYIDSISVNQVTIFRTASGSVSSRSCTDPKIQLSTVHYD